MHRFFRSTVVAIATIVASMLLVPLPGSAEAAAVKRAVLRFSMVAGATTGNQSPKAHSDLYSDDGIQWDIYGTPSADVRPAFFSSDGAISLAVKDGGAVQGGAGRIAVVTVKVDNVVAGVVRFMHLVSVNTKATEPGDSIGKLPKATKHTSTSGKYKGSTCYGWPCSDYWIVTTAKGIHVHLDINKGCYRDLSTWNTRPAGEPLAMVNSSYKNHTVAACKLTEMNDVNTSVGEITPPDFDGDGISDYWDPEPGRAAEIDVNGDGLPDVVGFANKGVSVALNKGASFAAPKLWLGDFGYSAGGWRVDKHPRFV